MRLRVKSLVKDEITVDVEPTDTILKIKEKLAGLIEGYPVDQQRLSYQGKYLKDEKSVGSYRLKDGHLLRLVKALRSA